MEEVIKTYSLEKIDILKVDIEGAEKNLFEHHCSWLSRVGKIGIELHDTRVKGCTVSFFTALIQYFDGLFTVSQCGEMIVVQRLEKVEMEKTSRSQEMMG